MKSFSRPQTSLVALIAAAICSPVLAQSPFTFTKIVDTNTAVPAGPNSSGNYVWFGDPSIDQGQVAFRAGFNPGNGTRQGVYSTAGGLHTVANWADRMPGSNSDFNSFGDPIISNGNVAFRGTDFFSTHQGIYTDVGGSLNLVADTNTTIPGGTSKFATLTLGASGFDGTNVVFTGEKSVPSNLERGVYSDIGGTLGVVADTNTPVPGGSGNFTFPRNATIDSGEVKFFGVYGGGQAAIFSSENGVIESELANNAIPLPGGGGNLRIQYFDTDGTNTVIRGIDSNGNLNGIYVHSNALSTVANLNTAIPDGSGNFTTFHKPEIDGGSVVFLAEGTAGQRGIYTTLTGALSKVIDNGDLLDGKTISSITTGNSTSSGPVDISGGQIVFSVGFTDGSSGIYVANYAPTGTTTIEENYATGSILGGSSQLGGLDFAFDGASAGEFLVDYSISHDTSLINPGIVLGGDSAFQFWNLDYSGGSFDSVLLTLNYNPLLVDGNLQVYHQFDGQAVLLTLGTLGNLGLNQYAISGNGLLQVRIGHFSEIIVTGSGTEAGSASSVPEPSSIAILGAMLAGVLGFRGRARPIRAESSLGS